jgi:cysteine desulfurase
MLVNNEVGTIQPLAEVAALMRERAPRALLHTDAVQAVPWLDMAVAAADAHLVSVSAHKFGGPKGVGVLVARDGVELEPQLDGGGQEQGRRAGTVNVAGAVAMAAALGVTIERRAEEVERIQRLRDRLRRGLHEHRPDCVFNGDPDRQVAGSCSVEFPGIEAEVLLMALDRAGVPAAAGSSCASGALEPSHVLLAMGRSPAQMRSSIRLTLGHSSTEGEVEHAIEVIPRVIGSMS